MCKQTAGNAAIRCHICRKRRYSTARGATQALCVHYGNSGSPNTPILPGLVNLRGQLEQGRVHEWTSSMAALLDFVTPSQSYTSTRATTSIRSVVPKGFLLPLCLELLKCAHLQVSARTHPQLALFSKKIQPRSLEVIQQCQDCSNFTATPDGHPKSHNNRSRPR